MNTQRAVRLSLLLTLLLAFGLRTALLGAQELRGDEAFGHFFSLPSPVQIVDATLELREPHPVASYVVQHFWLILAGDSEFGLRFVSVWCGVLAVALLYRLGRLLGFAPWGAWLAALLLAISPYAIWHSQDARMYSMSLALTLAAVYLALEALQRRRWQWSAGYVAAAWLALHTHYYAFFVLAGLTVFLVGRALVARGARPALVAWVWWNLLLALLYLPWLTSAGGVLADYRGNGDSPGLLNALQRAVSVFAVGESTPGDQRVWWALLAGLLLLAGMIHLALGGAIQRRALWLLVCYLFVPLLLTWWGARQRPIFDERYLIAASPAFYLLLAAAVSPSWAPRTPAREVQDDTEVQRTWEPRTPAREAQGDTEVQRTWEPRTPVREAQGDTEVQRTWAALACGEPGPHWRAANLGRTDVRRTWAAAVVGLAVLSVAALLSLARSATDPAYGKTRGWRELAAAVDRFSQGLPAERVRIAQNFPDPTLWYYYQGAVEHIVLPPAPHDEMGSRRVLDELATRNVQRVILPVQPADNWDSSGLAAATLARAYDLVAQEQVGVWPLQVYAGQPQLDVTQPLSQTFANGVMLTGVAGLDDAELVPGGLLSAALFWSAPAEAIDHLKVTVQLLGPDGRLVAQQDGLLAGARPVDGAGLVGNSGIILPSALSPGRYTLIAALYDPESPDNARILTTGGADVVVLAEYHLE